MSDSKVLVEDTLIVDLASRKSVPTLCPNCGKTGRCVNGEYKAHCENCYRGGQYIVCGCGKPFANAAANYKGVNKGRRDHTKKEGHQVFNETLVSIASIALL